jgi:hypothetical protein
MLLRSIRHVLNTQRSLIVHFSGTPRGIGGGQARPDFPQDLLDVRANAGSWEIPCSTVSAGHTRLAGDLMGSVGLILRCRRGASLLGVCHADAGSAYDPSTGRRNIGACVRPTTATCRNSIVRRDRHNEWILRDYEAVGLFMDGTLAVWDSGTAFERDSNIPEIAEAFPDLPLLYFWKGDLWEIHPGQRKRDLGDFI